MVRATVWPRGRSVAVGVAAALCAWAWTGEARAEIRFEGPIHWNEWAAGLKQASAKKKAVLLLLYTDSCPKCTLLGEVLKSNKDVHKLASGLVMVHVNSGTAPMDIVHRFARFGNYVPRIVFLRPDGSTVDDIVSNNPGFPYYYQPSRPEFLIASMQKAKALGGAAAGKAAGKDKRHSKADAGKRAGG
ncbi:MAG: thioredoxin family protein [Deltaproteobacteria bacterium]|nr:thioredoxin family protein [Deltaproteobacteria bacterium]